jgi:hypothetical protein
VINWRKANRSVYSPPLLLSAEPVEQPGDMLTALNQRRFPAEFS